MIFLGGALDGQGIIAVRQTENGYGAFKCSCNQADVFLAECLVL